MKQLPVNDLNEIALKSNSLHGNLRNANILILGPNGFIGNWLRNSFSHLNNLLNLNIRVTGIVRNEKQSTFAFGSLYRELTFQSWKNTPNTEMYSHVFHCATQSRGLNDVHTVLEREIIDLTYNAIKIVSKNAVPKFIHLSSGAVYGHRARRKRNIGIDTPTESFSNLDLYGQTKLKIENIVQEATEKGQISGGNPRLFSFFGPGLGLEKEFAISSFVRSAQSGNSIEITGNPATERTYMYPTDLITQLLFCADAPTLEPIHLGGSRSYSMREIAEEVARVWNVNVAPPKDEYTEPNFYNPEVKAIHNLVSFPEGLLRWKSWL